MSMMPVPNSCFSVLFVSSHYVTIPDPSDSIDMGMPEEFKEHFIIHG